ncbi:MAG: FAD-dependent oxidoreductase, partial [Acidobacteriota bacterium]
KLVARSLRLWQENEQRWKRRLFRRTGVLWFAGEEDDYEKASLPLLREAGVAFEKLTLAELEKRFPQVDFAGVRWGIYEPDSGYLRARHACAVVLEGFLAEGGTFRQLAAKPGALRSGKMGDILLSDGATLRADQYVFACGPWLGRLFPEVIGELIRPTRQEVFFFGTPAGDPRYLVEQMPVWIDNGDRVFYGIPGSERRGFKVADDSRGPLFDPTSGERMPTLEGLRAAREYLGYRFPGLKDAPLLEARVCTYENTADHQFIVDRHPEADNAWLVGGGSGHGFKHGPAMGELVAGQVLGQSSVDPTFGLSRFSR